MPIGPAETVASDLPSSARPPRLSAPDRGERDYSRLTGELQYSHARGVWRLRYLPPDEEDRHGGAVTLFETGSMMAGYRSGQKVLVEGSMVDPTANEPCPAYRPRSIHPVLQP